MFVIEVLIKFAQLGKKKWGVSLVDDMFSIFPSQCFLGNVLINILTKSLRLWAFFILNGLMDALGVRTHIYIYIYIYIYMSI